MVNSEEPAASRNIILLRRIAGAIGMIAGVLVFLSSLFGSLPEDGTLGASPSTVAAAAGFLIFILAGYLFLRSFTDWPFSFSSDPGLDGSER